MTDSLSTDLRSAFRRALSPTSPHAVFPATAIAAAIAQSVLLLLSFNSESGDGWNLFQVSCQHQIGFVILESFLTYSTMKLGL